jgi:hypothetical protein
MTVKKPSTGTTQTEGHGAPTETPNRRGEEYYDLDTGAIYKSIGTEGPWNWAYVGRGMLTSFNKDTIPGMVLWLDSSDDSSFVKDSGGLVSQWNDLSGNSRHFSQTTATYKPIFTPNYKNSLPAVIFDGSNDFLVAPSFTQAQPFTIFVVGRYISLESQRYMLGCNNADPLGLDSSASKWGMYFGTGVVGLAMNINYHIFTATINSTSTIQQIDATISTALNPGTSSIVSNIYLGSGNNGGYTGNVAVSALLMYSGTLSTADKTTVQTMLNNKFAIY